MRLNKFIAQATGISRREADNAISAGKVLVNDDKPELGLQVSKSDTVALEGKVISLPENFTYLLVNKPLGHVSSRNSQDGSPTLYDLIPKKYSALKYVGRLDKESSGLILMTDDGDYTHQLTHPSFRKNKVYEARLDRPLSKADIEHINRGVELDDGVSNMKIEPLGSKNYRISMSEGKNRQIRRTLGALGYTIVELERTSFGDYTLTDLNGKDFIEVKRR